MRYFLKIHLDSDSPLRLGLCVGGGWVGRAGWRGVGIRDHPPSPITLAKISRSSRGRVVGGSDHSCPRPPSVGGQDARSKITERIWGTLSGLEPLVELPPRRSFGDLEDQGYPGSWEGGVFTNHLSSIVAFVQKKIILISNFRSWGHGRMCQMF